MTIRFPKNSNNQQVLRVIFQSRDLYQLMDEKEVIYTGKISGRYARTAEELIDYPVVGDYVSAEIHDTDKAVIHSLLERSSLLTRKIAGTRHDQQPISSNVDTIFVTMSLNQDFNVSRIERYLTVAWDSGGQPVIVLTKSDLASEEELAEKLEILETVAIGVPVVITSVHDENIIEKFAAYLTENQTILFIGSSGVGKSTLTNHLMGSNQQEIGEIREDDAKGKHTTTSRQLIYLENGTAIIDTPGMREIGVEGSSQEAADASFNDIQELAENCRFSDCQHQSEPGCAVQSAIDSGELDGKRLENYRKLLIESQYVGLNTRQIGRLKNKRMFGTTRPKRFIGKK